MSTNKRKLKILDKFIKESKESREIKRAMAIKLYLLRTEQKKVSQLLSVSQPFVSKWTSVFEQEGISGLKLKHKGSVGHLSKEERAAVSNWIKQQASLTTKSLQGHIKQAHGIEYASLQSYYDIMKEANYSHKKSQKFNPKRDEQQVRKKRKEIKKVLSQLSDDIKSGKRKIFF
jgi:putative transposase